MEQYFIPKALDFENLRLCLDNYHAERIFIRDCGSRTRVQGLVKVDETLEGRTLDFRKDDNGLYILIDDAEVFHFPLQDYTDTRREYGFTLAYERIEPTEDGIGRMVMLSHGIDPYDRKLPEPRKSILRHDLDHHLMEIYFTGRVHLRFHSWFQKPHWKYWVIALPEKR